MDVCKIDINKKDIYMDGVEYEEDSITELLCRYYGHDGDGDENDVTISLKTLSDLRILLRTFDECGLDLEDVLKILKINK